MGCRTASLPGRRHAVVCMTCSVRFFCSRSRSGPGLVAFPASAAFGRRPGMDSSPLRILQETQSSEYNQNRSFLKATAPPEVPCPEMTGVQEKGTFPNRRTWSRQEKDK
ncbi:hypothetical protein Y1Q_0010940 [Alligator mississippiensis]|uniref:Uncharacterized protein n=1 Tax=Alligator mississippiensis TaxID=8496 RepID=A0A151MEE2_ALLMI|nr:hypothetical protein Y1Q_0010940 [Alligator mississippiensis]